MWRFSNNSPSKRVYSKWPIKTGLFIILPLLVTNCTTDSSGLKPPPANPIQLKVENNSSVVIDVIQAKPCGSGTENYKPQMNSIKPRQRIMLHIYEECVDLVAQDGFGNIMDELVGLRLNTHITWKIQ